MNTIKVYAAQKQTNEMCNYWSVVEGTMMAMSPTSVTIAVSDNNKVKLPIDQVFTLIDDAKKFVSEHNASLIEFVKTLEGKKVEV